MEKMTYEEAVKRYDEALEDLEDLRSKWDAIPISELVEYHNKEETHPSEIEYKEERDKILSEHLEGTGWSVEEIENEIERRAFSNSNKNE